MAASGEIYQVTYQGLFGGSTCENVIHFRAITGLITDSAIATAAERFWFLVSPIQGNDYLYQTMIIKRMTPIALDERRVIPTTVSSGSALGGSVNNTLSIIFTLRTGTAGKSHRGRIYFGGVPVGFLGTDQNLLNTSGAVATAAVAANLVSEFGPSGTNTALAMGIYSRVIGGIHPFTVAGWQQISGIDVQTVLGNQRRRRVGVGI